MKKLLILLLFIPGFIFYAGRTAKVLAADLEEAQIEETPASQAIINEVMANPEGSDAGREWFELANTTAEKLSLEGWQAAIFNDPGAADPTKSIAFLNAEIPAEGYIVVVNDATIYVPCNDCITYSAGSFNITNAKGKIILVKSDKTEADIFSWDKDVGNGYSMETVGAPKDKTYVYWEKSSTSGGTPGKKNAASIVPTVSTPSGISPINTVLTDNQNINFSWEGLGDGITYEFNLSAKADLANPLVSEENLNVNSYLTEDLPWGKYWWQVIASNGFEKKSSPIYSFDLTEPFYSNEIYLNEIFPNPDADKNTDEWFELYNNSETEVNLRGWMIEDIIGSTKKYKIDADLIIGPKSYLVFYRSETGITLNNSEDGLKLYHPDGELVDETPVFKASSSGWAYIKKPNNKWDWSTKPTPEKANIISYPETDEEDEEETPVASVTTVLSSTPNKISTTEIEQFENKLVELEGEVTFTSGRTFYIDDGSGEAKIYIQEKTGIQKPPMRRGDWVWVVGIVNYYRSAWRILPQRQTDLKITKAVRSSQTQKSSVKKMATATNPVKTSIAAKPSQARAPNLENVLEPKSNVIPDGSQTGKSGWLQFAKAATGLAAIFLILLIIKVLRFNRPRVVGGNFGNDET